MKTADLLKDNFTPDKAQWGKYKRTNESLNTLIYNSEQSDSKKCGTPFQDPESR